MDAWEQPLLTKAMVGWVLFAAGCCVSKGPLVQSCAGQRNTSSHVGDAVGVRGKVEEITVPDSGPNPAGGI